MSDQIVSAIEELRREQREVAARQEETLQFLKTEAEHARKIRDEAIAIQRAATARVRRISTFGFFGILACVFLIVYLVTKYRILF